MLAPASAASRYHIGDFAPLISLGVVLLLFTLIVDRFASFGTFSLIMEQGSVLAIAATGMTFVLLCAEIDLSTGMVALLSACLCGVLWVQPFAAGPQGAHAAQASGMDVAVVLGTPLVVALVIGWLSGLLTVSSRLPSFIITLAMMNIVLGLARFLTRSQTTPLPPVLKSLGNGAWHLVSDLRLPYRAMVAGVILLIAHTVLQHTRFGRYVYMTGGNREAARLAGVRTDRIVVACLAICGLTSAIAGLINAGRMGSASLDQNADLLLDTVACVVLGGTSLFGGEGGIGRTVIGVFTYTTLQVGLAQTDPKRLIRLLPAPGEWKQRWFQSGLVVEFDHLRPFVLGIALLLALVIHGRLVKRRD